MLVNEVVKDSPADKAGIEGGDTEATIEGVKVTLGGDIITEVDGKPIGSMEDVINAVNSAQPGDKMEMTMLRGDNETKHVTVTLGVRPKSANSTRRQSARWHFPKRSAGASLECFGKCHRRSPDSREIAAAAAPVP